MPIYEYTCPECGAEDAYIRPVENRDMLTICPVCGRDMRRRISPANFLLQGDGWARDGYSKEKKR